MDFIIECILTFLKCMWGCAALLFMLSLIFCSLVLIDKVINRKREND